MSDKFDINHDGISLSVGKRKIESKLADSHRHYFYELYHMTEGRAKFFIDNEIIDIDKGEVMIVQEGIIHKTVYEPGLYTERFLICFTADFVGEKLAPVIRELGDRKLISMSAHAKLELDELFNKLKYEDNLQAKYSLENIHHILCQILILLLRQKNNKEEKKLTVTESIIQSAARYIAENFEGEITLSALAKKYALSQSYFSKIFKSLTGFGVIEYITAIRISKAEQMLKTTNKSITAVASECGFSDSNYFATIFKIKNGITPLKYRTLAKKN